VPALAEGGADVIELGIPFSDPLADGVTIQRSTFQALLQGVTPGTCLDLVRRLRAGGCEAAIALMGYYNPIMSYSAAAFVRDAAAAGADGLIVVDLPPEEASELMAACREHGLDHIPLVAPTSSDARIKALVKDASGFVYCVSVTGVTGVRASMPEELAAFVKRVRAQTPLPVAVGFGISSREHFLSVREVADAAVIGSAIIQEIERAAPAEREERVKHYVEVVTGRRRTAV
jgi:tryptophan synthase alpha subunit